MTTKPTGMPTGRPSSYTQDVADALCAQLAEGKSLRSVYKSESMPCVKTVFNWFRTQPGFLQQYEKAKEESADAMSDEILEIADDGRNDYMESQEDGGGQSYRANGEHIQRSRLRVDARKWLASKLKPKKYGDKTTTELTGANGGDIKTVTTIEIRAVDP